MVECESGLAAISFVISNCWHPKFGVKGRKHHGFGNSEKASVLSKFMTQISYCHIVKSTIVRSEA